MCNVIMYKNKMGKSFKPSHLCYLAEREGFEPPTLWKVAECFILKDFSMLAVMEVSCE